MSHQRKTHTFRWPKLKHSSKEALSFSSMIQGRAATYSIRAAAPFSQRLGSQETVSNEQGQDGACVQMLVQFDIEVLASLTAPPDFFH